jgi:dolichol-phosphate mannosyltransferase
MNELTVILPAFNEEASLELLVKEWKKYEDILENEYYLMLKILIVNDGSTDKTKEVGKRLEAKYRNVKLISHFVNKGLGQALKTGIDYVLINRPLTSYVCIMDCDNTHDPKYVLNMIKVQKQTKADVVIASRYQKHAEVTGLTAFRRFTSLAAKETFSTLLEVEGVRDYTCGYRLYKKSILDKLRSNFHEKIIEESGFTCMVELLYKLYISGACFAEVPFELKYGNKQGKSKMKVIKTSVNSLKLAFRLKNLRFSN